MSDDDAQHAVAAPPGAAAADSTEVDQARRRRRVTVMVGAVCLLLVIVLTIAAAMLMGPRRPVEYGDWLPLDRLWDACADGDAAACDELFVESPLRTEYERFGSSCGDRFPGADRACVEVMTIPPERGK